MNGAGSGVCRTEGETMNKKTILILITTALAGVGGYFWFAGRHPRTVIENPPAPAAEEGAVVYENGQYGFRIRLPKDWEGYSVVTDAWEGYTPEPYAIVEHGPLISIRHPQWSSQNPRQDIPIMVFTTEQWSDLHAEKFHIGAAPMNPSALNRNAAYVFALPARYNYAFPAGWEDVERILSADPLSTTEPSQ